MKLIPIILVVLLTFVPAAGASGRLTIDHAERVVTQYTQRVDLNTVHDEAHWIKQDPKGNLVWTERSQSNCTRTGPRGALCFMGLVGRLQGEWIYCTNLIAVRLRSHPGRGTLPATINPWDILYTNTLRLTPDYSLDCYGDEIMRVDYNGEERTEGTWNE